MSQETRHTREGGYPRLGTVPLLKWIPAFARMTET